MIKCTNHKVYDTSVSVTLPSALNRLVLFMGSTVDNSYVSVPTSVVFRVATGDDRPFTLYTQYASSNDASIIWGYVVPDDILAGDYLIVHSGHSSAFQRYFGAVFSGVDKNNPVVDAKSKREGVATADGISQTVNTVEGGWVHDIVGANPAKSAGSGQTAYYNVTDRPGLSYANQPVSAGTKTMSWSWTDSHGVHSVVSLRPYKKSGGARIIMF